MCATELDRGFKCLRSGILPAVEFTLPNVSFENPNGIPSVAQVARDELPWVIVLQIIPNRNAVAPFYPFCESRRWPKPRRGFNVL